MSDLVGNPEDRFSRVEAHIILKKNVIAKKLFKNYVNFLKTDWANDGL